MTNTATAHLMSYLEKETGIRELQIFSDGASSTYHARYLIVHVSILELTYNQCTPPYSSETIVATPSIARQFGITVKGWNFFESQDGKNIADRMIAISKRKLEVTPFLLY